MQIQNRTHIKYVDWFQQYVDGVPIKAIGPNVGDAFKRLRKYHQVTSNLQLLRLLMQKQLIQ